MRGRCRTIILGLVALAVALSTGETWADRLVLKDGTELVTVGAWEVKGRLVVFHQPNGELASIRVSEVDFDKSTLATEAAKLPPPPPPPPPPKKASVMSLTEKDLPPVGEGTGGAAAEGAGPAAAALAPVLTVLPGWQAVASGDGRSTEVLGVVRNDSSQAALGVQVVAVLVGGDGEVLAEIEGASSSRALQPGQTTSFRVAFENGQPYERIEFRVNGQFAAPPVTPRPPAEDTTPPPAEVVAEDPDGE